MLDNTKLYLCFRTVSLLLSYKDCSYLVNSSISICDLHYSIVHVYSKPTGQSSIDLASTWALWRAQVVTTSSSMSNGRHRNYQIQTQKYNW